MSKIEPISDALKRVASIPSFQERYDKMKKDVLEHPDIQKLISENNFEVTDEFVQRNLPTFHEYINQSHTCCGAQGTGQCTNYLSGFIPTISIRNGKVELNYIPCQQKLIEDEQREVKRMLRSFHISSDILDASIANMEMDSKARLEIAEYATDFINEYKETNTLPRKGLYLHGLYGTGKSYILGALANEFTKLKIQTAILFVPEFFRELKSSLNDGTFEEKVDFIKKVPILMLDDLGAESNSEWTRDEILSSILNYRMSQHLPIFVSSNLSYEELERFYSRISKGDIDPIKGSRIVQRIMAMTNPFELVTNRKRQ
ncbi:MAG TPA: primosomal protein DnaI [Ureibacillus sp.]|nr:primosomal protein DnaI [Ureibacillus sp.]